MSGERNREYGNRGFEKKLKLNKEIKNSNNNNKTNSKVKFNNNNKNNV